MCAATVARRDVLKYTVAVIAGLVMGSYPLSAHGTEATTDRATKRIYIAPDDHTDYLWSAGEGTYANAFVDTLDYYLALVDATEGEANEHQSRWNCDGSFWMWAYQRSRTPAEFERLIRRIRDGHISVPLNALTVCLGGAPAEAVIRGMYYPGHIERRYNLRFPLAYSIENQTLPYGLGGIWAGSGARYTWKGICDCDSRITRAGDREHDVYWWVGPDGSRLLVKWNSLLSGNKSVGGYAEARNPMAAVEYVDKDQEFRKRYPYSVIGLFGKGWDDLQTLTDEFVKTAKKMTNSRRHVIVSNQVDFFEDLERTHGKSLPSLSCSFGNEWDLYCTTLAEVSASVKRSVEKLRGAEALSAMVTLYNHEFMAGRTAARDQAWMNLGLYWEHDWGMTGSGNELVQKRIQWQRQLAREIRTYVDQLQEDAIAAFAAMIRTQGSFPRFFVFNPLSWQRTDIAELPYSGVGPVYAVDVSTATEVPSQIVTVKGERRLRILAADVPAVGYKVFEVRPGPGVRPVDAVTISGNVIENEWYRIVVTGNGAISSLIDKRWDNREFVKEIGGRTVNDLGPGAGSVEVENAGAVSATLRATSSGPLEHTTRVTLIRGSHRISISNEITQNFGDTFTWAFGFDLHSPDVWHEEVGAVIRARLLTEGGHYSPRNARFDWLTLNHFVDMSSGQAGVTLSNADCYFMRLGNSTPSTLDVETPQISVLAGGRVGGDGKEGIRNQGGDTYFLQRFALHPHGSYDPVRAMRFSLEHQNPLITAWITGGTTYPGDSFSFLSISDARAVLWALKVAEDGLGQGLIARVWNLAMTPIDFSLAMARRPIRHARFSTHIETELKNAAVSGGVLQASLAPQQLQSWCLQVS